MDYFRYTRHGLELLLGGFEEVDTWRIEWEAGHDTQGALDALGTLTLSRVWILRVHSAVRAL